MNNVINWFEIPVADMDRAVAFYEPVMQVSLRRETRIRPPAARWPNLKVSRPRRRALLFICILIILPPRWSALPRRVGPVSSAR